MDGVFFEGPNSQQAIEHLADMIADHILTSGGTHDKGEFLMVKLPDAPNAWSGQIYRPQIHEGLVTLLKDCAASDERLAQLIAQAMPPPEPVATEPVVAQVQTTPAGHGDASDASAGDSSIDLNKKPTARQVRRTIEAYLEMLPDEQRGPVLLSAGTYLGILQPKVEP